LKNWQLFAAPCFPGGFVLCVSCLVTVYLYVIDTFSSSLKEVSVLWLAVCGKEGSDCAYSEGRCLICYEIRMVGPKEGTLCVFMSLWCDAWLGCEG
jgi:hypothetical protein